MKKVCRSCKKNKLLTEFYKNKSQKDGYAGECWICDKKRLKKYKNKNRDLINKKMKEWRLKNKTRLKRLYDAYYRKHGERIRASQRKRERKYAKNNKLNFLYRTRKMFSTAKERAKKKGLGFNLKLEDINLPTHCSVLGFKIDYKGKRNAHNIPSLDRISSKKGYVRGNVRVISYRANHLKSNATSNELFKIAKDLKKLNQ